MTKMIKMSLIAAVAVTGMTSAVNAQNLEDAIKGVDVSGYVDYRLEKRASVTTPANDYNVNEYAVQVALKSKVNDQVTANVVIGFDEVQTDNTNSASTQTTITTDANPLLTVINANFAAQLGSTTVIAGKQNIPSVFVDKVDTVKTGAGVVVVQPVNGYLTLAAAHFMNNNIAADTKTSELIAMGAIAGANYALHYNKTDIVNAISDRMYAKVNTKVSGIDLTGKYATTSNKVANSGHASVTQLIASGKISDITLTGAYAKKKQDTANASDVAIDSDNDAEVNLKVWQLSTDTYGTASGDVYALTASMPIMNDLTASYSYASADVDGSTTKYTENLAQLTYKMSKNFTVHGRYSVLNKDTGSANTDTSMSRLQVKYTF